MKFSMTGKEKKLPFNTGDHIDRFDCILVTRKNNNNVSETSLNRTSVGSAFMFEKKTGVLLIQI